MVVEREKQTLQTPSKESSVNHIEEGPATVHGEEKRLKIDGVQAESTDS